MKILEIDIETAPHSAFIWSLRQKYVPADHIALPGYTLCFAYRWRNEEDVKYCSLWDHGHDGMVALAWDLLNEADAIIHYNGDNFDIKMLNTEILLAGYTPPAPSHQIDLLKVVRRNFRFPSNKLDYVCKRLGIGEKITHKGMELWVECMEGDKQSQRDMQEYNIHDVTLLGPLYEFLIPWINNHPNHALFSDADTPVCPNCGGENIYWQGYRMTRTQKYRRFQCQDCGTWSQERMTAVAPDQRKNILKTI